MVAVTINRTWGGGGAGTTLHIAQNLLISDDKHFYICYPSFSVKYIVLTIAN
jgi:hypothetical protein